MIDTRTQTQTLHRASALPTPLRAERFSATAHETRGISFPGIGNLFLHQHFFSRPPAEGFTIPLARDLLPVYESGFLLPATSSDVTITQRFDDLHSHIQETKRLLVVKAGNTSVAFLCGAIVQTHLGPTYHLEGLVCHTSIQGCGLGLELLSRELHQAGAEYLCMHTQSAKMLRLFCRVAAQSDEVARELERYVPHRNPEGLIDRSRYGGRCLYGDVEAFKAFAVPGINIEEGDALFVAGRIRGDTHNG